MRLTLFNAALVATCLVFAITSYAPTGPALAFGVAALATVRLAMSGLFAISGLAIALAQVNWAAPQFDQLGLMVMLGLSLAALAHTIGHGSLYLRRDGAIGTGILLALAAIVVAVLPDSLIMVQNSEGTPLLLNALVQEAATGTRLEISVPAMMHLSPWLDWVNAVIPVGSAIAITMLAYGLLNGAENERAKVLVFGPLGGVGVLLMTVGVASYVQLVTGSVELPDIQVWRDQFNAATGGALIVDRLDMPSEGFLGPGSRPAVDVFRLIIGGLMAVFAIHKLQTHTHGESPRSSTLSSLLLGIAALAIPVFLVATGPQMLGLSAALGFASAAAIAGCFTVTPQRLPYDLALCAILIISFTLVAPMAGWMHA